MPPQASTNARARTIAVRPGQRFHRTPSGLRSVVGFEVDSVGVEQQRDILRTMEPAVRLAKMHWALQVVAADQNRGIERERASHQLRHYLFQKRGIFKILRPKLECGASLFVIGVQLAFLNRPTRMRHPGSRAKSRSSSGCSRRPSLHSSFHRIVSTRYRAYCKPGHAVRRVPRTALAFPARSEAAAFYETDPNRVSTKPSRTRSRQPRPRRYKIGGISAAHPSYRQIDQHLGLLRRPSPGSVWPAISAGARAVIFASCHARPPVAAESRAGNVAEVLSRVCSDSRDGSDRSVSLPMAASVRVRSAINGLSPAIDRSPNRWL